VDLLLITQFFSIRPTGMAVATHPNPIIVIMTNKTLTVVIVLSVLLMGKSHSFVTATTGKHYCFSIIGELMAVATVVSVRGRIASCSKVAVLTLRHDAPVICIFFTQLLSILAGGVTLPARPV
jgi:hypothetical protein